MPSTRRRYSLNNNSKDEGMEPVSIAARLCALYILHLGCEAAPATLIELPTASGLTFAFLCFAVGSGRSRGLFNASCHLWGITNSFAYVFLVFSMQEIGCCRTMLGAVVGSALLPSAAGMLSGRLQGSAAATGCCVLSCILLAVSGGAGGRSPRDTAGAALALSAAVASGALGSLQGAPSAAEGRRTAERGAALGAAALGAWLWALLRWAAARRDPVAEAAALHAPARLGFVMQSIAVCVLAVVRFSQGSPAGRGSPSAAARQDALTIAAALALEVFSHGGGAGLPAVLLAAALAQAASLARWRLRRPAAAQLLPGANLSGLWSVAASVKAEVLRDVFDGLERARRKEAVGAASPSRFLSSLVAEARKTAPGGGAGKQARLLTFLLINTALMFVEFVNGAMNNNLGLLSDGCHMLFDNASLTIGLYAAHVANLPPDNAFTFGYGRVESLAGFANGVLLIFVALEITLESIERMMEPPKLSTDGLLVVSVLGLVVNVVGLVCCHEAHEHAHGGSDDDDSEGDGSEVHDHNMRAVFLHILADTLGSISVIVSVLCIQYLGWNWADPVASLFISVTTMASVVPLLRQTADVLLLCAPKPKARSIAACRERASRLPGVVSVLCARVWCHTPNELCGVVHVAAEPGGDKGQVSAGVRSVYDRLGLTHLTVDVCEAGGRSSSGSSPLRPDEMLVGIRP
uniref:Solute carrier family 30 (Zinc transporter), member 5/7 n=1 Tax=Tetraselmis sp. GSL018 TaxID=582737 RepID=A0A061SCL4_9CHLO